MIPYRQLRLDEAGQRVFQSTLAFLYGRLSEPGSVQWAVRLKDQDLAQRKAVLNLLDQVEGRKLAEPWSTTWRLIEENWNTTTVEENISMDAYGLKRRLKAGDRSGAVVEKIVATVAPGLKVIPFSDRHHLYRPRPTRIRTFRDLFSVRIASGRGIDAGALGLENISETPFLIALAIGLESAVEKGLDIVRRMGWVGGSRVWLQRQLHRVYVVRANDRAPGTNEPDQFHSGLAPSVKLLHATVERLGALDPSTVASFLQRWETRDSPVHVRLWAAIARDPTLVPIGDVAQFLLSLDGKLLWNVQNYPEIAELRARRFAELDPATQARLLAQIQRGPARSYWRKDLTAEQVTQGKLYWIALELRRLEAAGFQLPERQLAWLNAHTNEGPPLPMRLDEGFPSTPSAARLIGAREEARYDDLVGVERLAALEAALGSARSSWTDDPAEAASGWVREQGHALLILADLEASPNGGASYPKVWDRFGWSHAARDEIDQNAANQAAEADRVLALLIALPDATLREAIEGLAHWAFSWSPYLATSANTLSVWLRLWPLGVEATNAKATPQGGAELDSVVRATPTSRSLDLDTLNTAAGKLIEVFVRSCPSLEDNPVPFADGPCRTMRDVILAAGGAAGLISRYRLIESIDYFLRADRAWTQQELLEPLQEESVEALQLWQALARRIHSREVLASIGNSMAERAYDRRLERDTRQVLIANLVIEGLYSIKEQRDPEVARPRITQTLRAVDDEIRAHAADTVRRFVSELSSENGAEHLVRNIVVPFMETIWPQESSLTTPGVARAFAQLPAAAGRAFSDAVIAIERFLVPFDCWSLLDYGLFGDEENGPRLALIDSPEKAHALLKLLALTIGGSDGAVIPQDLSDALKQIRSVTPALAATPDFRRLATAARRT